MKLKCAMRSTSDVNKRFGNEQQRRNVIFKDQLSSPALTSAAAGQRKLATTTRLQQMTSPYYNAYEESYAAGHTEPPPSMGRQQGGRVGRLVDYSALDFHGVTN